MKTLEAPVRKRFACISLLVTAAAACGSPSGPPVQEKTLKAITVDPYQADVEKFRQQREAKLTGDAGWLTIAGLYFLTKPETTVGSAADSDVVLPAGAPPKLGTFTLAKNKVSVR